MENNLCDRASSFDAKRVETVERKLHRQKSTPPRFDQSVLARDPAPRPRAFVVNDADHIEWHRKSFYGARKSELTRPDDDVLGDPNVIAGVAHAE